MEKLIAYCGINCSECPAYIATQKDDYKEIKKVAKEWSIESMSFKPAEIYCDGCTSEGKHFSWCGECPIRSCCQEKGYQNCAYCEDYACEKLEQIFQMAPDSKKRLDEIRRNL